MLLKGTATHANITDKESRKISRVGALDSFKNVTACKRVAFDIHLFAGDIFQFTSTTRGVSLFVWITMIRILLIRLTGYTAQLLDVSDKASGHICSFH